MPVFKERTRLLTPTRKLTPSRKLQHNRKLKLVTKGYALSFDGVDDYVEVPDSPSLRLSRFTITAWFKSSTYDSGTIRPFAKKGYSWAWNKFNYAFCVQGVPLKYILIVGNGTDIFTLDSPRITSDEWHFGAGIYDGHYLIIYHDREEIARTTIGAITPYVSTDKLLISRSAEAFNGIIALVCIYNRALNATEIQWNYEHPDNPVRGGLVLWLDLTSIEDGVWRDRSGYGNDGVIYGATPVFGYLYYNKTLDRLEFVRGG